MAGSAILGHLFSHELVVPFLGSLATSVGFVSPESWVLHSTDDRVVPPQRAYERLLEGVGDSTPDWQRLVDLVDVIGERGLPRFNANDLAPAFEMRLRAEALSLLTTHERRQLEGNDQWARILKRTQVLLERLASSGIVRPLNRKGDFEMQIPRRVANVKMKLVYSIAADVAQAVQNFHSLPKSPSAQAYLEGTLREYAQISERWPLTSVESRWSFLQAIPLLSNADRSTLKEFLDRRLELRSFPLIDNVAMLLGADPGETWLKRNAPHLVGRRLWTTAAEGWYPAGGLGRVQQYHAAGMQRLAGQALEVATVEPYYPDDYAKEPVPEGLATVYTFDVRMPSGKRVSAIARRYDKEGISRYLIHDAEGYYTKRRYSYNKNGSASYNDFCDFFDLATAELIDHEERARKQTLGERYRAPAIIANDGQMGRLPYIIRSQFAASPVLREAGVAMVTHTYNNRYGELIDGWDDPTSRGIYWADIALAVSAIHRDEVSVKDPYERLKAVTNGDDRKASRNVFQKIWNSLFEKQDSEFPTADQVLEVKRAAKSAFDLPLEWRQRLGLSERGPVLDPEALVISYSGRAVDEKLGLHRAFTENNLRRLVREGAQVVLYANAQVDTQEKVNELIELARSLNQSGGPGKLIVRSGWGLEDQRKLLAATDAQVQDSHRHTEAAGYTESDASANAALQIGPPFMEGIIQRQGVLINRNIPGHGNTLIPRGVHEDDYMEVYRWLLGKFRDETGTSNPVGRQELAAYQATSVRLSQMLEAVFTSGEYFRQLNSVFEKRDNPLSAIQRWVGGEPEMEKYFRKPWVRARLIE